MINRKGKYTKTAQRKYSQGHHPNQTTHVGPEK